MWGNNKNPNDNPEVRVTVRQDEKPVSKWIPVHNSAFAMDIIRNEVIGKPIASQLPHKLNNVFVDVDKRVLDEALELYNKRYGESRGRWTMENFIAARHNE